MGDRLGQQLGNYRLVRLLGQGGFADVYLGEHIHLNSRVAIKVLQVRLVGSALEQFREEGRTIARLVHPNIVRVFDFGLDDGTPYLVMDYAPNGTLRQRYSKGTVLSPVTILPHFMQLARALQYAHDHKILHRDIKPENMLLGSHHEVLLSDFGLALPAQSSGSQTIQEMSGTLPYMAPEQINGRPRYASDQYSLGVVLYEWLSGERPFDGSLVEIATQHMTTPPAPLYRRVPGISRAVEEVLFIALAKDPLKRFDRIETFALALEHACLQTRADSMALPTVNSSHASSADPAYRSSPPQLSGEYATQEATFTPPAAGLTRQSTIATPRNQLAPAAPAKDETAQSPYATLPMAGQPVRPTATVTPPAGMLESAGLNTPPGYGASPVSDQGTPGQYHRSAAPRSTAGYPARRSRTAPVFAGILIAALVLILVSGAVLFLPKAFSSAPVGNGATPTQQSTTAAKANFTTQAPASDKTPTHTANGSAPSTRASTVTSVPTIVPTTPVNNTGPAVSDFAGVWYNVDPNTQDWVRVEISAQGNTLMAHFFGACTPTPCDAGSTSTTYSGSPVSMTLTESFAVKSFTLTLSGNTLHITTFTHFTDNSGRQDYTSQDDFHL